jgi:hypothetical protein
MYLKMNDFLSHALPQILSPLLGLNKELGFGRDLTQVRRGPNLYYRRKNEVEQGATKLFRAPT